MIRILVADDHPIMRKGLKQLFSETDDMAVTGEASDGVQVLETAMIWCCWTSQCPGRTALKY